MTRIEELRNLVKQATSGPWNADGPVWNRIVWSSLENRICFMAHSNGLNDDRDIANSRLIAEAPTLAADLAAALEREAALREALTLIERIYYLEEKDAEWKASRMNGIAREAQDGGDLGHYRRIFPSAALGDKP